MGRKGSRGALDQLGELLRQNASRAEVVPPQPAPPKIADEEIALFRRAVHGATPIAPPPRAEPPHARAPAAPIRAQFEDHPARPSPGGDAPRAAAWTDAADAESHLRPGMGSDVLRKLRRLQWPIQAELSVRRMTQDEASDALEAFVGECVADGLRCVRVVHGKGNQSPDRAPVLKGKVKTWLARKDEVLAFCQAPPAEGGGGALLVLLRARS